jgi:GAF domain-containing protein
MDPHTELETSLVGLSNVLMDSQPLVETLSQVAWYAAQAIPGADGAGLTLLEVRRPDTMVASEDFVRAVDEVQYRIGEGPCLLAVEARKTQVCGSLGGEQRWPRFGPRAGRLGVHSALSLPLMVDERVVGALNVYGRARDAFDEVSVRAGELFSGPAAVTVANAQVLENSRRLAEQLDRALTSRAVIDQAIGILRSRTGGSAEEAFQTLRAMSQSTDVKLVQVAELLLDQAISRARVRHAPPSDDDRESGSS